MIICLDTETTGLSSYEDEILTIAIVDAETGVELLNGVYKPQNHDSWPEAMAVNGITPDMVKDCPPISDDAKRIRDLVTSAEKVVVYNVSFDIPFLERAIGELSPDMVVNDPMLDFACSESAGGTGRWLKLVRAADAIGYRWTGAAHGALADARAAAAVWRWLRERGETNDVEWSEWWDWFEDVR